MKIGVDYYPEQWDERLWEEDADKMKEAGVKVVRMAEFAWSRLEPKEHEYCFEWLDKAVEIFAKRRIQVFLCTPTCTPPLWLFEKYPETIQVGKDGRRISIGIRGHRCMNSPVYRQKCKEIITQMVSRYRDNEWVIGYQIDNELEANHCCCPVCEEKFRDFVRQKYGTIEEVNRAYGNQVWSGEYSSFSQIRPPFGEHQTWLNPSYMLDFNRYASQSTVDYVTFQRELIHSLDEKALITTNNWFCENMPDFYDLFENLDFVSYDNYPTTVIPEDEEELYSHAFHLDFMRGIKQKNFWIMEQLSGSLGSWTPMSPALQSGMLKGYAMQAIAHGADTVLHFRWRTAVAGAEMFWHGILDHNNVPGRRYQEFCDLCETVNQLDMLDGSVIKNDVAILYSSEQEYAFKIQPQVEGMHYFTQLKAYHDAFTCLGAGVDIVNWMSDLSQYRVVVAPTLFVTNDEIAEKLEQFVRKGGHLVLTNRSGVKNADNRCIMAPLPTVFAEMAGISVTEYDPIGSKKQLLQPEGRFAEVVCRRMGEQAADRFAEKIGQSLGEKNENSINSIAGTLWCDIIESEGAEVLARYNENFYKGSAAITRNLYEKGNVYYVGTVLTRKGMIALAEMIAQESGMEYVVNLPVGVERTVREKGTDKWTFLFNNTDKEVSFSAQVINGEMAGKEYQQKLAPFEMCMLPSVIGG
ncbi:MAG: beta-galactosidase [Butyribacter sp.]|nr:beta-galactosidase [bacterium]MDY3854886.1 beta-galactosidase [Butyribacter sp.]